MKRFMNTVFVFLTLTALMLGAFGASPAYAADDQTRPLMVTGFGPVVASSFTVDDVDGWVDIQNFNATGAVEYMITTTSTVPDPAEGGWYTLPDPLPATVSAYVPSAPGTYTLYPWVKDAAGNVSEFYYGQPEITVTRDYAPIPQVDCDGFWGDYVSNSTPVSCSVWFRTPNYHDDAVTGFVAGDVTLAGVAGTPISNWKAFLGGVEVATASAADTFTFDIPLTVDGEAEISVAAGVATDLNGNLNKVGTPNPLTYLYETTVPTVSTFTLGTAAGYNVPVTDFTKSDVATLPAGICGELITTTSTPPSADSDDWMAPGDYQSDGWDAPETAIAAPGYTLYPWALDCAGNVSAVFPTPPTTGALPAVDDGPELVSFERYDPKPVYPDNSCTSWSWDWVNEVWYCSGDYWTNADTLVFLATFDKDVKNVDKTDFVVDPTNPTAFVTTATVTDVATVSASEYEVTVSGGDLASFNGYVALDLAGSPTISDLDGNAMTVFGSGSPDEAYRLDNIAPVVNFIERDDPTSANTDWSNVTFYLEVTEAATHSGMLYEAPFGGGLGLFTTNLTGAAIVDYGDTYCNFDECYVEANTGTGNGTIRLDVVGDGFTDKAGNSAAPFTVGQAYTIVKGAAPTVPVLVSPKNNSLTPSMTKPKKPLLPEPLNPWQPVLDWKDSAQVQKLASWGWAYEVQLNITYADGTVETEWAYTDGDSDPLVGLADSQFDFADWDWTLPAGATVVWKVRSYNGNNQYSAWSKPFTFRTPYAPPQQTAPRNGKMLETTAPDLSWETVAGATGYTVTVYDCTGVATTTTCTAAVTKGKSFKVKAPAHTVIPKGLKPETNYEWSVKAEGKNADKVASVSGRLGFKTSKVTPTVPMLLLPKNNAAVVYSDAQQLSWKQVVAGKKGEPAAHHYEVQVSVDPSFVKNYSYSQLENENFSDFRSTAATVSVNFLGTEPGRTYYWRVRAWSADGAAVDPTYSGWSKVSAFKVKYTSPWIDWVDNDATKNPVLHWTSNNGLWKAYKVMICAATDLTCKKALKTYTVNTPVEEFTVNPATEKKPLPVGKYTWKVQITGAYGSVFSADQYYDGVLDEIGVGTFEITTVEAD